MAGGSRRWWKAAAVLAGVAVSPACDSADDAGAQGNQDAGEPGSEGAGTDAAPDRRALDALRGSFDVRLIAANPITERPAISTVVGKLKDGIDPERIVWTQTGEAGECVLLEPSTPFCDPDCGLEVCVDGECVGVFEAQDVGRVHMTGLGDEITMDPIQGNYQSPTLPYPPCDEGAGVELTTEGGDYPPFTLEGTCVAPLDLEGPVPLRDGEPVALTWSAPGQPDLARIEIRLDISHHGGVKGVIRCETEDDGALEIPAALSDQLVALGIAGFPSVVVTRVTRGGPVSSEPAGVALEVQATREVLVDIPGLVSCFDTSQCPDGQTCGGDNRCQ